MAPLSVEIRRASVADAEALTRHFADPAVYGGLLQLPYPSLEFWSKRLAEQSRLA